MKLDLRELGEFAEYFIPREEVDERVDETRANESNDSGVALDEESMNTKSPKVYTTPAYIAPLAIGSSGINLFNIAPLETPEIQDSKRKEEGMNTNGPKVYTTPAYISPLVIGPSGINLFNIAPLGTSGIQDSKRKDEGINFKSPQVYTTPAYIAPPEISLNVDPSKTSKVLCSKRKVESMNFESPRAYATPAYIALLDTAPLNDATFNSFEAPYHKKKFCPSSKSAVQWDSTQEFVKQTERCYQIKKSQEYYGYEQSRLLNESESDSRFQSLNGNSKKIFCKNPLDIKLSDIVECHKKVWSFVFSDMMFNEEDLKEMMNESNLSKVLSQNVNYPEKKSKISKAFFELSEQERKLLVKPSKILTSTDWKNMVSLWKHIYSSEILTADEEAGTEYHRKITRRKKVAHGSVENAILKKLELEEEQNAIISIDNNRHRTNVDSSGIVVNNRSDSNNPRQLQRSTEQIAILHENFVQDTVQPNDTSQPHMWNQQAANSKENVAHDKIKPSASQSQFSAQQTPMSSINVVHYPRGPSSPVQSQWWAHQADTSQQNLVHHTVVQNDPRHFRNWTQQDVISAGNVVHHSREPIGSRQSQWENQQDVIQTENVVHNTIGQFDQSQAHYWTHQDGAPSENVFHQASEPSDPRQFQWETQQASAPTGNVVHNTIGQNDSGQSEWWNEQDETYPI